jgi:hypothetical protein
MENERKAKERKTKKEDIGFGGDFQAQQESVWNVTIYFELGLQERCYSL